jgi:ribosomal protein S18 acetylase RimI-like enzyme
VVGSLTVTAYAPVLRFGESDPYTESLADAAGRAAEGDLLVALVGDDIVGTVTVGRPGTSYAEVAGDDELEVRMLAVAPTAQRLGIGRALMTEVLSMAEVEGVAAIVLSVIDTNTGAAAFYRSLGYQRLPERDWVPVPHVNLEVWIRQVVPRS